MLRWITVLSAVLLLIACMSSVETLSDLRGYDVDGPCSTIQSKFKVTIPCNSSCQARQLSVTVTVPDSASCSLLLAPYPLLLFFNGFKFKAYYYSRYMSRMASWGYVTLQYDTPLFEIIPDATELTFLQPLLDWASMENASPGSPLFQKMDMSRVGVGGHSRGAKLAGLHFAAMPTLKAAYLVDPVDNTSHTPEGAAYPSACKALLSAGRAVGITGAGRTGSCSPEGSNFKKFYSVAAPGSWLMTIPDSSHSQLADAGSLINKLLDLLCGKGKNDRQETIGLAMPPLVAWMEQHMRRPTVKVPSLVDGVIRAAAIPDGFDPLAWFMKWVQREQSVGLVHFEVKAQAVDAESQAQQQHSVQSTLAAAVASTVNTTQAAQHELVNSSATH